MHFRKIWIFALFTLVSIGTSSCSSNSSRFLDEGKTRVIEKLATEGDVVAVLNAGRSKEILFDILGDAHEIINRINDIVVILRGTRLYAVVEGEIPNNIAVKTVLSSKLNAKEIELGLVPDPSDPSQTKTLKCYSLSSAYADKVKEKLESNLSDRDREAIEEVDGFYFNIAERGVILFSTSREGYGELYSKLFDVELNLDKSTTNASITNTTEDSKNESVAGAGISESLSLLLQSSDLVAFGYRPKSDFNIMFRDSNTNALLLFIDDDKKNDAYNFTGHIKLKDKDSFKVVNSYLNNEYIKELKKTDVRLDIKEVNRTSSAKVKDLSINYFNFKMPKTLLLTMINGDTDE